jgi:hypothetical protein
MAQEEGFVNPNFILHWRKAQEELFSIFLNRIDVQIKQEHSNKQQWI